MKKKNQNVKNFSFFPKRTMDNFGHSNLTCNQVFHPSSKPTVTPTMKMMAMGERWLSSNNTHCNVLNFSSFSCQHYFMPLIWNPELIYLDIRNPEMI